MPKGASVKKKYVVELTKEERERLLKLIRAGEAPQGCSTVPASS
jgi:hypothetical protein